MLIRPAEESFKRGIKVLSAGRQREALAYFEAALELESRLGGDNHQARYLSYYGLCLAIAGERLHEAVRLCRTSVQLEEFNPDLVRNLGDVLLRANRRKDAYQTLLRGLRLQPDHQPMRRLLTHMGRRRRPPLPFLSRDNPINIALGRLRRSA